MSFSMYPTTDGGPGVTRKQQPGKRTGDLVETRWTCGGVRGVYCHICGKGGGKMAIYTIPSDSPYGEKTRIDVCPGCGGGEEKMVFDVWEDVEIIWDGQLPDPGWSGRMGG